MGIPDYFTCLLRNLYANFQEATVRTGHGITDLFQISKRACQGCILSPCLFNLYAEYILRNAGLDEAQAGVKIGREISITSDVQMTPPLWQKAKSNWRASWWKWKRRVKKVGLKLNIQKTKITASSPITSWQIDVKTMETVTLYLRDSKITADGDCSHEIKRCSLFERKDMTNLDRILKSRDITLPTKVCLVKAMVFFLWSCMDVRFRL